MVGGEGSGSVIGLIDDEVGDLGQKISMLFDSALFSYPRQHVGGSVGGFRAPYLPIGREGEIADKPSLTYPARDRNPHMAPTDIFV